MATFTLPGTTPPCEVELPHNLTRDQLLGFRPFRTWLDQFRSSLARQASSDHAFHKEPYGLRGIKVQAVDFFGDDGRIGFVKLAADVRNGKDERLPASMLLRGGSVAMLLLLQPDDVPDSSEEKYAIMTLQPRVPAGSLAFAEIPAGMLDDSDSLAGAAAKEITEETGLELHRDDLIDLTALALQGDEDKDANGNAEGLHKAVYPSAGGCDETMAIFLHEKRVPRSTLAGWQGKLTGLREEGEKITLKLVPYSSLWREGARDAKTLAAIALYEGLKREGRL